MIHTARPIHVLLVEDNPGDAFLLRSMLRDRRDYELTEAATLLEAKRAVAQAAFDAALLDLSLPDSDGLETVDAFHAVAPEVPIVVLTGMTDEDVAMAAVRRGAQDYLTKGRVDAPLVARTIRYAIDRKLAELNLQKARDELERKVEERTADLRRLNRTLEMIGACTQALVHGAEEEDLAGSICRIIGDRGGYPIARVLYSDGDAAPCLRVIASAAPSSAFQGAAATACTRTEVECELAGRAVRSGQAGICLDRPSEPDSMPGEECAFKDGFRSAIALPLTTQGRTIGALMIFAQELGAFDASQADMLSGLASDLAFGIAGLRARAERDRAELALAQRAEQLRALATELTQAEQRERRRLAQLLHDELQQLLVGAKYNVELVKAKTESKAVLAAMGELSNTLDESIRASRSLTVELSPPILHDGGLAGGLEWLGRHMHEKHGLQVAVDLDFSAAPSSDTMRGFLFEAVRELLFNVVKHAGVRTAQVRLFRLGREIRVEVSDGGRGFASDRLRYGNGTSGLGLFSITERIGFLGGRLEIDSAPSLGSRITLVTTNPPAAQEP